LPEYMIPTSILPLEEMPITANGKVDRKALPKPYTSNLNTETIYEEPTTNRERVLTEIWEEVLSRKKVGITDNFFEIGGDSILAIRLIAKAKEQGLNFTPKDLFHHRTIANLVSVVREVEDNEEQGLIEGNVPLTPVQQWFFETILEEPNHFNQSLFLQVRDEIDPALLKKSFDYLIEYHDALRSRFSLSEEGWKQENVGLDGELQEFKVIDLADHSSELQKKEMGRIANRAQQELSIEKGPLVNVRYFNLGRKQPNRILIIIHHLVVDGVSWRILLDDLHKVYQDLKNQEEPKLPSKTMSYKKWAEKLLEYVDSDKIQKEKAYWLDVISKGSTPLAIDYQGENTVASTDNVSVELNQAYTASLLQEVPKTYHTQIQEILLMVLGETFSEWIGRTPLLIDVEGHGREQFDDEVDCSRTVGWFTSIYPVQIGLRNKNDIGEGIKQVKEGIRKIPNGGIDYGVLKYLGSNEIPSANSEVSFNYLGQIDQALTEAALFKMAHESVGLEQNQDNNRPYVLEISGKIMDETLQLNWRYSKNLHERRTISKLANEYMDKLREVINHCLTSSMEYTPSDFPEAKLNQKEFTKLIKKASKRR
ncbi:condensation domain-containing protein, partial [Shouchella xiaoxiensis]|uniref:condensation domain-containing protein n=1 Tax=Shouchella xiaoxiensis TaxID=766895 RepID=UPI001EF8CEAA